MPEETLKQVVDRVAAAKTAIGNAIIAKGGTVASGDGLEEYPADIATIPSGGIEPASPKDVNFYDYDGTCIYSYTADEFSELTAFPPNPTHEGLTAQGWNWSLADAKQYVTDYDKLNVGQMYITSDGKTRLYITLTEGRTSPILQLYLNANSELDIDWGDGAAHSTFTSTTADYKSERHVYASAGDYVIVIAVVSGGFVLQSSSSNVSSILWNENNNANSPDRAYSNAIKKIEIGNGVTSINNYAFCNCTSLSLITIPDSVTSIGSNAFLYCNSISAITIPDNVTSISSYILQYCRSISVITIPDNVTSIGVGAFYECRTLSSLTIPDGVTSIGNGAFSDCNSLSSIIIPDSVTSISNTAFKYCYPISAITIPDSVTSIGSDAFSSCSSLSFIKFDSTTPPTISNVNAWTNTPSDCYILVPLGTLDDYLNTTNMPDDSTYLYLCYAKYASGTELPTTSTDGYSLTWYASKDDARAGTNPITVGNGKEIYSIGA